MLTALAQEPWCFHADQIATLTDDQILFRYLKPAVERWERVSGGAAPGGNAPASAAVGKRREASTGPPGEPGSREHRAACIGAYMQVQGLSEERAKAQYERQLAQWHEQQASNAPTAP